MNLHVVLLYCIQTRDENSVSRKRGFNKKPVSTFRGCHLISNKWWCPKSEIFERTCVHFYGYILDEDRPYITQASGHISSFQFEISGVPKDEIVRWSIEQGSNSDFFQVTDNGKVSLVIDPSDFDEAIDATLTAKLENGTKLKARLHGYSERGIAVKKAFEDFDKKYIIPNMTQYEKMETIAKYVEYEFDYVPYQPDWRYMVISGGGDCYASRYFVKYLCEAQGIKALALLGENLHGKTLVKADGRMYIVVTGIDEPKPRRYMIMQPSDENLRNISKQSRIDLSYFE